MSMATARIPTRWNELSESLCELMLAFRACRANFVSSRPKRFSYLSLLALLHVEQTD